MTIGTAEFDPVAACWICGGGSLVRVHQLLFDLSEYARQDPELAAYSGARLGLCRCATCGFAQPEALPALPRYFDRMYDQRWSDAWIVEEFESTTKDAIFGGILKGLARRLGPGRRRLLDVGAHAGRFLSLARAAGWQPEGLELNPRTASYAAQRTGLSVRQLNVADLNPAGAGYDAITITDVLEHIPKPLDVLSRVATLLAPGGCVAVKVPCGASQLIKERWRQRLSASYRATVADNLVHVSHFTPRSLALALARTGFAGVVVEVGIPELPPGNGARQRLARGVRRLVYTAARVMPGGVHTPLALNLQAYATRP